MHSLLIIPILANLSGQAPSIQLISTFSEIVLPQNVEQVPVLFKADNGPIQRQNVPLTCTSTLCTGEVVESRGGQIGRAAFQIARSQSSTSAFPLSILQDHNVLAAGHNHGLVVRNGSVWSYGDNSYGQLGYGYKGGGFHPKLRKIPGLSQIASVYAGAHFSVALDSAGDVWTWGSNQYGKLGNGMLDPRGTFPDYYGNVSYNNFFSDPVPKKVLAGKKVFNMSVGRHQVFAVDSLGAVWGWGWNQYFMRVPATKTMEPTPIQLPWIDNVRSIHVGGEVRYADPQLYLIAVQWSGAMKAYGSTAHNASLGGSASYSTPIDWAPSTSSMGTLIGPVAIRTGVTHVLLEYIRPESGEHVILARGDDRAQIFWSGQWNSLGVLTGGPLENFHWFDEAAVRRTETAGITGVQWKGRFPGSQSTMTSWTAINDTLGLPLSCDAFSLGEYHAMSREATTGRVWVWGTDWATTGGTAQVATNPRILEMDSVPLLNLELEEMNGDTVFVPSSVKSLEIKYKVGVEAGSQVAQMDCREDGVCKASIIVLLSSGVRIGKTINIARKSLALSDFENRNILACADCQDFIVSSPVLGLWTARIWRIDQAEAKEWATFELGSKTASEALSKHWVGNTYGPRFHSGIYATEWIWSGYGRRDSIRHQIIGRKPYGIETALSRKQQGMLSVLKFIQGERRLALVTRSPSQGVDSGDPLTDLVELDSNNTEIPIWDIDHISGRPITENAYLFIKSWTDAKYFVVRNSGPIISFRATNTLVDPVQGAVTEVQWATSHADSTFLEVIPEYGPPTRMTLDGNGSLTLTSLGYSNPQKLSLRLQAWRDGMISTKYLGTKEINMTVWGIP